MMEPMPLVSIVTPSYNSARFIESCIQSVLSQSYPNVEHIVQDAGSTDGTVEILQKYNDCIHWVSEPDKGESDGLNRALQRSRGEIIGVLNADDEYLPHALSWAVEHLTANPQAAVIYGDQYTIDSAGKRILDVHSQSYDFRKVLCVEHVIPAQAAFVRRRSLEAVGFYADTSRNTCPDYEMWIRLGLKFSMQYVPGFVVNYRWHAESIGGQASIVPTMVTSKREVIERTLSASDTPDSIKSLRRRAHSGVVWWGATVLVANGEFSKGIAEFYQSLRIAPSIAQIPRIIRFLKHLEFWDKTHQPTWRRINRILIPGLVFIGQTCQQLGLQRQEQYGP